MVVVHIQNDQSYDISERKLILEGVQGESKTSLILFTTPLSKGFLVLPYCCLKFS